MLYNALLRWQGGAFANQCTCTGCSCLGRGWGAAGCVAHARVLSCGPLVSRSSLVVAALLYDCIHTCGVPLCCRSCRGEVCRGCLCTAGAAAASITAAGLHLVDCFASMCAHRHRSWCDAAYCCTAGLPVGLYSVTHGGRLCGVLGGQVAGQQQQGCCCAHQPLGWVGGVGTVSVHAMQEQLDLSKPMPRAFST